ncbi:hypothetical protein [Micromonospora sp. NPDC006431]|uniref:hypothetical protein n=1 Tax=Micromonospora sp. NPDC006431 TaxID=3364235 RepID=UPI003686F0BE
MARIRALDIKESEFLVDGDVPDVEGALPDAPEPFALLPIRELPVLSARQPELDRPGSRSTAYR